MKRLLLVMLLAVFWLTPTGSADMNREIHSNSGPSDGGVHGLRGEEPRGKGVRPRRAPTASVDAPVGRATAVRAAAGRGRGGRDLLDTGVPNRSHGAAP